MRFYVFFAVLALWTAVVTSDEYVVGEIETDNNNSTDDYPVNDTTPSETTTLRETTAPSGTTARGFILTPSNTFSDTDRAIIAITVVVCGLVFFGVAFYGCAKHQQTKKEKNKLYKKYLSVANGPDLGTDNLAFSR